MSKQFSSFTTMPTRFVNICRLSLDFPEDHYEGREREPDRRKWGPWFRAPYNTLRTYAGGGVPFPVRPRSDPTGKCRLGYEVGLDECRTNDDAWGWVQHLSSKTWVSVELLRYLADALFDLGYITGFPSGSQA